MHIAFAPLAAPEAPHRALACGRSPLTASPSPWAMWIRPGPARQDARRRSLGGVPGSGQTRRLAVLGGTAPSYDSIGQHGPRRSWPRPPPVPRGGPPRSRRARHPRTAPPAPKSLTAPRSVWFDMIRGFLSSFGDMTLWSILASCIVIPYISSYPSRDQPDAVGTHTLRCPRDIINRRRRPLSSRHQPRPS